MLNMITVSLFVGAILGLLSGLGVGGGSLLILWLTLVLNTNADNARIINLMFFVAAAGANCLYRFKKGSLNIKEILPAILCGCAAAAGASLFNQYIDQDILRKLFGGLLLITGIRELFYRPRKAK